MAGSVNKVILIGNLGNDPDVRVMQSGDKVVNLSIATSESWKDKTTGEKRENTQWHRVVIFNQGLVKVCESYLKKGQKVYIEGQLETRSWEDGAGVKKYTTEIVLRPYRGELTMLASKGGNGPPPNENYDQHHNQDTQHTGYNQDSQPAENSAAPVDKSEEEIPF